MHLIIYAFILTLFNSNYHFTNDVLQNAFFIKYDFYFIARFIQSIFSVISAIYVYKIIKLRYKSTIAYFGLFLSLLPFNEVLSSYTIRIDSFMATFAIISIYYLIKYSESKIKKDWYLGVFIGTFIFAVKPLPSASIFAVFLLSTIYFKHDFDTIFRTLVVAFVSIFITYPYSILNFKAFYEYNYSSLMQGGDAMANKIMGYDFTWLPLYFGYIFSFFVLISIVFLLYKAVTKFRSEIFNFIILIYPLIYILLFSTFGIRPYWYLAILPFIFIFISILYENVVIEKFKFDNKYVLILVGVLLSIEMSINFGTRFFENILKRPAAQAMFEHVQANIKNNEKLGFYLSSFYLIAAFNFE